jgi:hypothetical protein
MLFVRTLKGSKYLAAETITHWTTWLSYTLVVVVAAYIIASVVPSFGNLIALIGALLGVLLGFEPMPCMWFHDTWTGDRSQRSWR